MPGYFFGRRWGFINTEQHGTGDCHGLVLLKNGYKKSSMSRQADPEPCNKTKPFAVVLQRSSHEDPDRPTTRELLYEGVSREEKMTINTPTYATATSTAVRRVILYAQREVGGRGWSDDDHMWHDMGFVALTCSRALSSLAFLYLADRFRRVRCVVNGLSVPPPRLVTI